MSSHALGPWKVVIAEQHIGEPLVSVIDAEGNIVCDNETYYPQALDPKNAHLIATAPDLLESLIECLPCLGWEHDSDEEVRREHELGNGYAELIIRARAAIAKATQ